MPFPVVGRNLGGYPFGLILGNTRQTPEIDRVKLHGPHIEKVVVEIVSDLSNDLRLSNAARTPDMQGHTFANERMERLIELDGFMGFLGRNSARFVAIQ